jgi:hypothetical protein
MTATRYCDKCVVNPAQKNDNLCEDCRRKVNKQEDKAKEQYDLDTTKFSSTRNWLNSWAKK